jgi:hypothetical protein
MRSTSISNNNNSINTIHATSNNGISGRDSSQDADKGMTTSISSSSTGSSRANKAATTTTPSSTATATSNSATVSSTLSVSDAELEAMFAMPSSKKGAAAMPRKK